MITHCCDCGNKVSGYLFVQNQSCTTFLIGTAQYLFLIAVIYVEFPTIKLSQSPYVIHNND
jgi:hypothetical protein